MSQMKTSTDKVAVILTNYNMPERADVLAEHFIEHIPEDLYDLYLVDNGSDQVEAAKHTTVWLPKNLQTCNGWLKGLKVADAQDVDYFAYWIMITSAEPAVGYGDILSPMVQFMRENDNVVAIHPALTEDSTTAWKHLITRGGDRPRRTWMVDNIAALYRADWFNSIGRFDPKLTYAWGTDLETCYKARLQGRAIYVDERVRIKKVTNIGYTMDRMGETSEDRVKNAYAEAQEVLMERYGLDWESKLRGKYVLREWQ